MKETLSYQIRPVWREPFFLLVTALAAILACALLYDTLTRYDFTCNPFLSESCATEWREHLPPELVEKCRWGPC